MTYTLFFEPLDVLVFKDHRPFLAGEQFLGRSSLPMPSVLLGCIRTTLFEQVFAQKPGTGFDRSDEHFGIQDDDLQRLLGGRTKPPGFSLFGPLVGVLDPTCPTSQVRPFFPLPLDLKREAQTPSPPAAVTGAEVPTETEPPTCTEAPTAESRVVALSPRALPGLRLHLTASGTDTQGRLAPVERPVLWHPEPWQGTRGGKAPLSGLLSLKGLRCWQHSAWEGAAEPFRPERALRSPSTRVRALEQHPLIAHDALYQTEERVGIARDPDTRRAEDHMLYTLQTLRFAAGAGLALELQVNDPALERALESLLAPLCAAPPLVKPGGKNHLARLHVRQTALLPSPAHGLPEQLPKGQGIKVVFLHPLPLGLEPLKKLEGFTFETLITDRGLPLGGFDLAARAPKPLVSALAAGTVLFYRAEGPTTLHAFDSALTQALADCQLPPGHASRVVGCWNSHSQELHPNP